MNRSCILGVALGLAATFSSTYAADKRYPVNLVSKIEIVDRTSRSSWEDKDFLDCDDVVLTEEDVRHALRHMRKVSRKSYFSENTERSGCSGGASVTFKTGKIIVIGIEPTGRINTFESNANLEPTAAPESFYDCAPCKTRNMGLLKDAFNRADERRLRRLEAEGKIPSGSAEERLKRLRADRER